MHSFNLNLTISRGESGSILRAGKAENAAIFRGTCVIYAVADERLGSWVSNRARGILSTGVENRYRLG
jgi:hypothetical protein